MVQWPLLDAKLYAPAMPVDALSVTRAIVVGAPRSGTTFLMGVLDALGSVEAVSGNLFPVAAVHLAAQDISDDARDGLERGFRGALRDYLQSGLYRSRSAALRKWWSSSRTPIGLAAACRGTRNETVLAYKEPFLAFAPELALRALPNASVIHLSRDGRDVADSLVRSYDVLSDEKLATLESNEVQFGRRVGSLYVPWWISEHEESAFLAASPYLRAIWMWRTMAVRCREAYAGPGYDRVLSVRYEDLVADPRGEGEAIAGHLGVPLTARARRRVEGAHARSIGAHRTRSAQELREAELIAGAELRELGYELTA